MSKERLDSLLTIKQLMPSRERAKVAIKAGLVLVDGKKIVKPSTLVDSETEIRILGDNIGYVSRGGLKLAKALEVFPLDLHGKVGLDIGASTGGFTDCSLQNGAKKMFAVDVGHSQLAEKLRQDKRVVNMERTNIRYVTVTDLGEQVDFITIDVAFISLGKVLPVIRPLLKPTGYIVALIKPQFEAGKEYLSKRGVVRDAKVHKQVIKCLCAFAVECGYGILGLDYSPVKGPEGNIEYLLFLGMKREATIPLQIDELVLAAHTALA